MKILIVALLFAAACSQNHVCPGYEKVNSDQCRDITTGRYADQEKCTACQ